MTAEIEPKHTIVDVLEKLESILDMAPPEVFGTEGKGLILCNLRRTYLAHHQNDTLYHILDMCELVAQRLTEKLTES